MGIMTTTTNECNSISSIIQLDRILMKKKRIVFAIVFVNMNYYIQQNTAVEGLSLTEIYKKKNNEIQRILCYLLSIYLIIVDKQSTYVNRQ